MKRRRLNPQLTEHQQFILALLLVILVAISLLYCLGLGSLILRQAWRNTPLPWEGAVPAGQNLEQTPMPPSGEPPLPTVISP